jgi:hypothetical protein
MLRRPWPLLELAGREQVRHDAHGPRPPAPGARPPVRGGESTEAGLLARLDPGGGNRHGRPFRAIRLGRLRPGSHARRGTWRAAGGRRTVAADAGRQARAPRRGGHLARRRQPGRGGRGAAPPRRARRRIRGRSSRPGPFSGPLPRAPGGAAPSSGGVSPPAPSSTVSRATACAAPQVLASPASGGGAVPGRQSWHQAASRTGQHHRPGSLETPGRGRLRRSRRCPARGPRAGTRGPAGPGPGRAAADPLGGGGARGRRS